MAYDLESRLNTVICDLEISNFVSKIITLK